MIGKFFGKVCDKAFTFAVGSTAVAVGNLIYDLGKIIYIGYIVDDEEEQPQKMAA